MAVSDQPFTVCLSGLGQQYSIGEEVKCTVNITNIDSCAYHLLTHYTPLEGLSSHIFHITVEDKLIEYDGAILKRSAPSVNSCVEIKAGDTVAVTVDLSHAHSIDTPGKHTVQLKTTLRFHRAQSPRHAFLKFTQEVVSNTLTFTVVHHPRGARLTLGELARRKQLQQQPALKKTAAGYIAPKLAGESPPGEETTVAFGYAYTAVAKSNLSLTANVSHTSANVGESIVDEAAVEWFGGESTKALKVYSSIQNTMETTEFTLQADTNPMYKMVFAYTYKGSSTIYLCGQYRAAKLTGTDSKMGTIVHELSHAVAYTDDVKDTYGQDDCRQLARTNPNLAVRNADNFEYYAEWAYKQVKLSSFSED